MEDIELKNKIDELITSWKDDKTSGLISEEQFNKLQTNLTTSIKESVGDPVSTLADQLKIQNEQNRLVEQATGIITMNSFYKNFLVGNETAAPAEDQRRLGFNRFVKDLYRNFNKTGDDESYKRLNEYRTIQKNAATMQTEGTDAAGGYLVPTPTANLIIDDLRESGLFFSETTLVNMTAKTLKIPVIASTGHPPYNSPPMPARVAEAGKKPVAKITFGQVNLSLEKYACLIPWTDELMEDSIIDIEAFVRNYAKDWFSIIFDDILFNGDATLNGLADWTTSFMTTSTTAMSSITIDNLINAIGSMRGSDLAGAKWYMSPATWAMLHTKKGTTNDMYYLNPMENIGQKTLLGFPVVFTDSLPTPATSASTVFIVFGNLKKVIVGVKNGMTIDVATSNVASYVDQSDSNTVHYAFQENLTVIRLEKRVDLDTAFPNRILQIKTAA